MRILKASLGAQHNARVRQTWSGTFPEFVALLLNRVPETEDKSFAGWVCAADFEPEYRHGKNFVARHFLSFDYDHIEPGDIDGILACYRPHAYLAHTTWSHDPCRPRLRLWLPVSRPLGYDEFQACSRLVAARYGIEKAARESHVPAQYMFRPTHRRGAEFHAWHDTEASWLDADETLIEYLDWTDRAQWPHRADGDLVHTAESKSDPLSKPGVIGVFNRAYSITEAIEAFDLPYKAGSHEGRWTYTLGSRPDGAIIYDGGTKLHSHHDTDPARGQSHAYDLVRLHRFASLDSGKEGVPIGDLPSTRAMLDLVYTLPKVRSELYVDEFADLDAPGTDWMDGLGEEKAEICPEALVLPARIAAASSVNTDQSNARRIQQLFGTKLIAVGGAFHRWTGTHWAEEEAEKFASQCTTRLSKIIAADADKLRARIEEKCRREGVEPEPKDFASVNMRLKWAEMSAQAGKLEACMRILRRHLSVSAGTLNLNPHLLNCRSGTLDLRTGQMGKHDPRDFITACAPVHYDPEAKAPRFGQFLLEIYDGNQALIDFVNRWLGYCATGSILEHNLVFHIGQGRNGKGVLMRTMRNVLGPGYYSTAPMGLFGLDGKGATPELADLLGRRMVTISETPDGMEIAESLVKQLTGGDPIKARKLYKDHFEFLPTHKLQVFTNHPPIIKGQETAIWNRILLLEYPFRYGTADQIATGDADRLDDIHLEEHLASEAPGIFAWLVRGARAWYAQRLSPPAAVRDATNRYRRQQDIVGTFLRERTVAAPEAFTAVSGDAGSLYSAYRGWIADIGHRPLGRLRFTQELLRAAPKSRLEIRKTGSVPIHGLTGLRLTESSDL